jgi:hypothetical protein
MNYVSIGNGLYVRTGSSKQSSRKRATFGGRQCAQCKTAPARWDSLYCSENCKQRFHAELRGEL